MTQAIRHIHRVDEHGQLVPEDVFAWRSYLSKRKGQRVFVTVTRFQAKATQDQHGYYRGVVLPILAEEWGWGDPTQLHIELKARLLPGIVPMEEWPMCRIGHEVRIEPPSHADLDVEQFRLYLDAVLAMAADAGVIVPPPTGSEDA